MPELPEVETVRRGLAPVMDARRVARLEARRPDLRFPLPDRFAARVSGARIDALSRRGKYLLAPLDTGETLIMHLGMSGRFTISEARALGANGAAVADAAFAHARAVDPAHDHILFHLDDGGVVTFNDPRRFGYMALSDSDALEAHPLFASMGPEPLSDGFTAAALTASLRGRKAPIKAMLLDQRIVAGLGNIYVCEALFRAGIRPTRPAGAISAARLARLTDAIKAVLDEAIAAGGSSLRDYAHADGSLGYFQHAFAVYGREGEACRTPGCAGEVARLVQSGRSTFFCPLCQR